MLFSIIILFFLGACVGSFINVLVYRSAASEGWVKGRSKCDYCRKQLAWFDNIPLLSFLFLQGKARCCKKKISYSHILVESLMGALFVWWYLVGFFFFKLTTAPFSTLQPLFWLLVGIILLGIFISDLKYQIIPDVLVFMLLGLVLIYRFALFSTGIMQPNDFYLMIISTLILAGIFLFLYLITRGRGFGFGDVKFALPMGLLLGFPNIMIGFFLSFLIGAITGLGLILIGNKKLKSKIAFGPFLIIAILITLLWGQEIWTWYLGWL